MKRFTDTDKWKRAWFSELPNLAKLVWFYIHDECDHCGVWHGNFKRLNSDLGEQIDRVTFEGWFGERVIRMDDGAYLIPSFVPFQQGKLSSAKNAHKPIIAFLEERGFIESETGKLMASGSHQDPIPMGPSISISKGLVKKGGVGENKSTPLVEIWNQHRGSLAAVRGASATRLKHAESRWSENPSTEYWAEIVTRIARSPFCQGNNDRGWKADFDFLIRPDTQHKVLEGKYDSKTKTSAPLKTFADLEAGNV